jgi:GAF domain-containing protein
LDQCLPKTARTDSGYHHRCLDLGRARGHYRQRWWDRPLLARWRLNLLCRSPLDKDWQDCWSGLQGGEVAYKSVLAVPITFRQHASRQKLGRKLVEVLDLPEEGRAILGFLIVDHPASFYFDDPPADSFENLDVNVLYLFADTLSLALLTARTYTTASTTVRSYLETRQAQEQ